MRILIFLMLCVCPMGLFATEPAIDSDWVRCSNLRLTDIEQFDCVLVEGLGVEVPPAPKAKVDEIPVDEFDWMTSDQSPLHGAQLSRQICGFLSRSFIPGLRRVRAEFYVALENFLEEQEL